MPICACPFLCQHNSSMVQSPNKIAVNSYQQELQELQQQLQPFYGSLDFVRDNTGETVPEKNIHPLRPIVVINHPLSASSIFYDPWHPLCSIYIPVFFHYLSPSFLRSTSWSGTSLHTPCISSPNHCLLFAAHAHTIATCFAVVPKLCHLMLVSLSALYLLSYKVETL